MLQRSAQQEQTGIPVSLSLSSVHIFKRIDVYQKRERGRNTAPIIRQKGLPLVNGHNNFYPCKVGPVIMHLPVFAASIDYHSHQAALPASRTCQRSHFPSPSMTLCNCAITSCTSRRVISASTIRVDSKQALCRAWVYLLQYFPWFMEVILKQLVLQFRTLIVSPASRIAFPRRLKVVKFRFHVK